MSKKVQLFVNNTKEGAVNISKYVEEALLAEGYIVGDFKYPDIVIGFGGDGTLLKWLGNKRYRTDAKYIGVNCGTLGFMQDFEVKSRSDARELVKNISSYSEEKLRFVSLALIKKGNCTGTTVLEGFDALNEICILNNEEKSFRTSVSICDEFFENFVGTGLIFSSHTGSTARNLSSGGSIICPGIDTVQMTPIEPIVNRQMHCLPKSICVPKSVKITLLPMNPDKIKIIADGTKVYEGEYEKLVIECSDFYMTKLCRDKNSFIKAIKEKLI